jgi:hypothetical protein
MAQASKRRIKTVITEVIVRSSLNAYHIQRLNFYYKCKISEIRLHSVPEDEAVEDQESPAIRVSEDYVMGDGRAKKERVVPFDLAELPIARRDTWTGELF